MKSGTVVVRGSLTGEGIPLHAGQRLVASLANKTLVVSEVARAERPLDAPATAHVVAPRDERRAASRVASALVAQAAPELTLRDAPAPAESPETLARLRALSPPPFEPAPPPPPPEPAPAAPPAPAVSDLGLGGAGLQRAARCRRSGSSTPRKASASSPATPRRCSATRSSTTPSRGAAAARCASTRRSTASSAQSGEAVIYLPRTVDLRGKTVTVRFMVRAPDRRRVRGAHRGGPGRSSARATATTRT